MAVQVSLILQRKGAEVFTVSPDMTVAEATRALAEHSVGALPVSADGRTLEGIVSERDVVRQLARLGAECLQLPVAEVMTTEVTTCGPETTVDQLMVTMTERRIRHLPVLVDGALAGVVSIGDVVSSRLQELELRARTMEEYVTGSTAS